MLPATFAAAEKPGDHVGPEAPDMADVVADDLVVPPFLDRFFDAEREPEVDRPREELLRAVEAVHGEELLGPQDAERLKQLGADLVLAAVAARRGHEHRAHTLAEAQHRQQRVVLIVGMRGRLHERADRGQLPQHQLQAHVIGMLAHWLGTKLTADRCGERQNDNERNQAAKHVSR